MVLEKRSNLYLNLMSWYTWGFNGARDDFMHVMAYQEGKYLKNNEEDGEAVKHIQQPIIDPLFSFSRNPRLRLFLKQVNNQSELDRTRYLGHVTGYQPIRDLHIVKLSLCIYLFVSYIYLGPLRRTEKKMLVPDKYKNTLSWSVPSCSSVHIVLIAPARKVHPRGC
eukprot:sb/3472485/